MSEQKNKYKVVVVGSGPGGYVAAIRCAQLGFETAIIERYPVLGGTCLNVGCIPSKALLDSSEHYHNAAHHFSAHGIEVQNLSLNFEKMVARKATVVKQNGDGVQFLMKKNKITVLNGHATLTSPNTIEIKNAEKNTTQTIETEYVIIATGSKPATLPNVVIDKKRIITSTEALNLSQLPASMVVIGGGVIGVEMASVYARLGTKVTIVEYANNLIAAMDKELGVELQKVLKKIGIEFYTAHGVTSAQTTENEVIVTAKNNETQVEIQLKADYCLVAVGRKPYTHQLGLENVGITPNPRGQIAVNNHLQTTQPNIFAIGDVIDKGVMLAHKAEEEGIFVAETIANQHPHINYNLIPNVVYTWPEVASVGKTEAQLTAEAIPYKVGKFPFKASGRARASNDLDGFVKILAHPKTDEILGTHIIGPRAADLIAEAAVAMEYRASAEDLARICHAHPTFTEALKEAALAANNQAIHI